MRRVLFAALIWIVGTGAAFAQCSTQMPGGTICGNKGTALGLSGPLISPVLGVPGVSQGSLGLAGTGGGTVTLQPSTSALGSSVATLRAGTYNVVGDTLANTFTAAQVITTNATALQAAQTGSVLRIASGDGVSARYEADAYGATAYFSAVVSGGTNASRTALSSGTELGGFNVWGYNGTGFVGPRGAFRCYANQTWTTGANGTYCDVATTPNGATAELQVVQFNNDGGITVPGTVTGGDKGAGTINAAALYANGNSAAISASSPLVLNAATGNLTCPTCVTGTGGALINGTTPTTGYTSGQILSSTGSVLSAYSVSGSGNVALTTSPAFTTPSLGAATATSVAIGVGSAITSSGPGGALGSNAFNSTAYLPLAGGTMVGTLTGADGGTWGSGGINGSAIGQTTAAAITGTAIKATTSVTSPDHYGGTGASASNTVASTSNGTPSGDILNLFGSTVTIGNPPSTGAIASVINIGDTNATTMGITVNIANSANGLTALNVYTAGGSKQQWVSGGGNTTITFPGVTDTLVGLAATQTLTNKTINGAALSGTLSGTPTFSGNVTFSADPLFTGLASGTCSSGLAINSSNQLIEVACPGVASSIQVGVTGVTSGVTGDLLYDNGATLGNSAISGFLSAGAGISITGTTTATIALSLGNASTSANPSNPSPTTSTTGAMQGIGASTCRLTPVYSGRVFVHIDGNESDSSGSTQTVQYNIRYGTGAGPANNAAPTGTILGPTKTINDNPANNVATFVGAGVITGLSTGTALWIDLDGFSASGPVAFTNITCVMMEY